MSRPFLALLVFLLAASCGSGETPPYRLLIQGGTVVDGSGAPAFRADVAVRDGKVDRVGDLAGATAARVIDAAGLVVAPGFVDVHTHADDLADTPGAENFLRMGVTTIVAGNCGSSALDVGSSLAKLRQSGAAVNFGTLLGHGTVRQAVMGGDRRAPTPAEMEKMKALVVKAMADGALGLSTGLQYVPGSYAEPGELVELARVACGSGGLYASHMRNEGTEIESALAETIAVGEAAGCPVQVSHLKIDSPSRWGASDEALTLIDAARARGIDVAADQYAYTAAGSGLAIRFPDWALAGTEEEVRRRFAHTATWRRIAAGTKELLAARSFTDLSFAAVASYEPDPSLQGLTMKQVAEKLRGSGSADAQLEAARQMMLRGGAAMVYHLMSEEDVEHILVHPRVAIASDSSVLAGGDGRPHPRGYGNNARVLGLYVREKKLMRLEEAVRKMTSLPAAHFKLAGRGLVQEGYAADLVLFDPAKVADRATFEAPHAYAEGFPYVIVNGVPVIDRGELADATPGQVLSRVQDLVPSGAPLEED